MGWGLVPCWWSKPLKELRLATFNARIETVTTKPFFKEAFKRTRCLIPASGYYQWEDTPDGKQPHYFTRTDGQVISLGGIVGRVEGPGHRGEATGMSDDHHRAERDGRRDA
jgi:putative SOS response-associated peptidase YedK